MDAIEFDIINLIAAIISIVLGVSALYQKANRSADLSKYLRLLIALLIFFFLAIIGRIAGSLHVSQALSLDGFAITLVTAIAFGLLGAIVSSVAEDVGLLASWGASLFMTVSAISTIVFSVFYVGAYNAAMYENDPSSFYLWTIFGGLLFTVPLSACWAVFELLLTLGSEKTPKTKKELPIGGDELEGRNADP